MQSLPRSSVLESERSLDCFDRTAGSGSCIDASVGIVRPRCTTKPACAFNVSELVIAATKSMKKSNKIVRTKF